MRRFNAWAVGLLAAGVVIGCGPGKEIPDEVPPPKATSGPEPDPFGPVPAQSDPAARAVLDRAVKAITENVPGGREKVKSAKSVYKGEMRLSQGDEMTKAVRTIETVWPDHALWVYEFKGDPLQPAKLTMMFFLQGNHGWVQQGLQLDQGSPADLGRIIRTDMTAQYWLMLGLTLAEPRAVVFDMTKTPAGSVVKVAMPNLPVSRVTFDDTSGLPVRVEYYPIEKQQRVHKVFTMKDHKPAGGIVLPGMLELTQNDSLVERWVMLTWEFPETIDLARFNPLKQ